MAGFGDDLREAMAEKYEKQIEHGGIDCPTEDCESENFDAEVWVADTGGFEGTALCRGCNTRIELDFEDSEAQGAADDIEDSVEDLQDQLDDLDG
jgi:hypothetical protein